MRKPPFIGLQDGKVELLPHHAAWFVLFEQEAFLLKELIGNETVDVLHIGSTAIPNIHAKPIIDILLGVPDLAIIPDLVGKMKRGGYVHKGENGIAGRHFFTKGKPRSFHVHATTIGSEIYVNHLKFRDVLLQNPLLALEYEALKLQLAATYPNDRSAYTEGKNQLIANILNMKII